MTRLQDRGLVRHPPTTLFSSWFSSLSSFKDFLHLSCCGFFFFFFFFFPRHCRFCTSFWILSSSLVFYCFTEPLFNVITYVTKIASAEILDRTGWRNKGDSAELQFSTTPGALPLAKQFEWSCSPLTYTGLNAATYDGSPMTALTKHANQRPHISFRASDSWLSYGDI